MVSGGVVVVVLVLLPPLSTTQAAIKTRASHPGDLIAARLRRSYDLNA
jgi:hypothetical protein